LSRRKRGKGEERGEGCDDEQRFDLWKRWGLVEGAYRSAAGKKIKTHSGRQ